MSGIGDLSPWSALADSTIGKVVDKVLDFIPDPVAKAQAALAVKTLDLQEEAQEMTAQLQQLAINLEEAKNENLFVSGGRPAFLWIGVAAFGYTFVVQPFLVFVVLLFWPDWPGLALLPKIDWTTLGAIVIPLLGISRDRSNEKQAIIAAQSPGTAVAAKK